MFLATLAVSQDLICKGIPYPSRSEEIARTISIISAIGFVIVTLRLASRLLVTHIWWDDWAIIAASVSGRLRRNHSWRMLICGQAFMFPMSAIAIYCVCHSLPSRS